MTRLVFHSSDPIPIVRDRILAEVGEPTVWSLGWPFAKKHKLFCGNVREDGFRLHLIIDHRNTYLPVACGRFESQPTGTRVVVQLHSNWIGVTFNILWSLGWTLPLIGGIIRYNREATDPGEGLWAVGLPLLMIAFVWVLMIPAELVEDREYERALRKVIQGVDD